jgi:outer membrane protein assembly factor BamB
MVRIRVGTGWREDPSVRLALARGGPAAAEAARRAADAISIEVDGVDVAAGRAEGALFPSLAALAEGVARLVSGAARASAHVPEGTVELLLRRRGTAALLSVVSLGRPARVLARDVAVELPALAAAVREAGAGLVAELAAAHPAAARSAPVRELRRALGKLEAARPAEPEPRSPAPARAPRPRRPRAAPMCLVELRDEEGLIASYRGPGPDLGSLLAPGRVVLRSSDGAEVLAAEGVPFLLLRDLAALGERIAAAVRAGERRISSTLALPGRTRSLPVVVDLGRGTVGAGGAPPASAPPLLLAEALLAAAVDFCGVVAARNAWQAGNEYLVELLRSASVGLAHLREVGAGDLLSPPRPGVRGPAASRPPRRPLVPGHLRRLAWRRAWEMDVGPPAGAGLFPAGDLLVLAGATALAGLDPRSGAVRWRAPGAAWAALDGRVLLAASGSRLTSLEPDSGRERWSRPLPTPDRRPPHALLRIRAGPLLLAAGPRLTAVEPTRGAFPWHLEPPGASRLAAASFGALAAVAADTGLIYGVDRGGRVAWRLVLPGPPSGPPVAWGPLCATACSTAVGGAVLALDPATGARAWEAPLDFAPSGPPLAFAGLLAVPGTVAGDPVVAAIEPGGAVAWTVAPPLGRGPPALAAAGSLLVVRGGDGACAGLGRDGSSRWLQPRGPVHPPPPGLAPQVARGVVVVPGDPVVALDAHRGAPLGQARLPPPARLLLDADLGLVAMDADGLVAAARLTGRLGVVG